MIIKQPMKKTLSLLICCLIALNLFAQKEHLKFMGIPLNGTITAFQSKLQAKGVRYDQKTSSQLSVGCRAFNGAFSGEKATIFVYYNEKTKIVYRAKAVITYSNKDIGERRLDDFKQMLKAKYANGLMEDGEQDGHPSLSIMIPDSKEEWTLGYVSLYMTDPPYSFMDDVNLHLDYEDKANHLDNKSLNMDDL